MPSRVIAFFLSVLMLLTSVGTIELPDLLSGDAVAAMTAGDERASGSIQQHHLDDQPSHAAADGPGECPALLPSPWPLRPAAPSDATPRVADSVSRPAPAVGPPLRPPCGAARHA